MHSTFNNFIEFIKKSKKIIFNNKNNNMELTLVIPGHYQEKSSLNSEKPTIIRVLGPDMKKDGYWLTADNISIPEYQILEHYIYLDTAASLNKPKPLNKNFLFSDFPIGNPEDENDDIDDIEEVVLEKPTIEKPTPTQQNIQPVQKFNFDTELIEKLNIERLNKINFDKFGESNIPKPKIKLELEFEVEYDIDKIRQTISLLGLDSNSISKYLISKIKTNFNIMLEDRLKYLLENEPQKETPIILQTEMSQKGYSPTIVKHIDIPPTESGTSNIETVESEISSEVLTEVLTEEEIEKNLIIKKGIESIENFLKNNNNG